MRSRSIVAVVVAVVALGLGAFASGALRSDAEPRTETASVTVAAANTTGGLEALLRAITELVEELRQAFDQRMEELDQGSEEQAGTLRPSEDDAAEDAADDAGADVAAEDQDEQPCDVAHESGQGWNRTEVRCHYEEVTNSGNSISVSSSSSSSTTTTSSSSD